MVHAVDEPERLVGGFGELAEVAQGLRAQGHVEVSERGDRRDQLDAALGAVVVEFEDVARGERAGTAPGLAHRVEREGVFDVELELVVFVQAELVGPVFEPVEGGDAPAGDVEVVAARFEGGSVLDVQAGQGGAALADELTQSLHAVTHTLEIRSRYGHAVRGDIERICTGRVCMGVVKGRQGDESRPAVAGGDIPFQSGGCADVVDELHGKYVPIVTDCARFVDSSAHWQQCDVRFMLHGLRHGDDGPSLQRCLTVHGGSFLGMTLRIVLGFVRS